MLILKVKICKIILQKDKSIFLTHGHVYNKDSLPKTKFDAVIYGHFHQNFISEKDGILSEKEGLISTLETDKENLSNNLSQVQDELNELKNYKLEVENNKKKEILSKYQKILDAQTYEKYSSNTDDYTIDQLEKSLAYEFVLANENAVFENAGKARVPRDDMPLTGIEAVLEQYK